MDTAREFGRTVPEPKERRLLCGLRNPPALIKDQRADAQIKQAGQ
jgi:hypothetical protein